MSMSFAFVLIFGTIALLSISVVIVFAWAVRTGQFSDFQHGATSIFDDNEPVGEMTDWFPGQRPSQALDPTRDSQREPPETSRESDVDHA